MTSMTEQTSTQPYIDQFQAVRATLPGQGLPWLAEMRAAGLDRFVKAGFPTSRQEAWKYTSLRPLEKLAFTPTPILAPAALPGDALGHLASGGHRVVFVNGRFRPDLSDTGSLPTGVVLESLAGALERNPDLVADQLGRTAALDGHPLLALNMAFLADGVMLHLPKGVSLDQPVELLFIATPAGTPPGNQMVWHPRILVEAEPNAHATIVERHLSLGGGTYFANVATEVVVGQGASLRHYKLQAESLDAFHLATWTARLGRDSRYETFLLNTGAKLSRNEVRSMLDDTGVEFHIGGAYAVRGSQHTDLTSLIDHAKPHGTSREVVKGVIDDRARAVFQGKIVVRPGAQKTDGHQLNRALLLSDTAEIDAKPELEIYADDVKCSHGATAGELDDDQLFYLRARGLPLDKARGLLIEAFLDECLDEISHDGVRERFQAHISGWMEGR